MLLAGRAVCERIVDQAAQECETLDQFGSRLREQQDHAGRDHQVHRPADQPAGVL
jgi:hypothetical protein